MKFKKILITGSAGFIGFHVAKELLSRGMIVVGVDEITDYYDVKIKNKRNNYLKKDKNYHFYKSDIAEYKKLETIVKKENPQVIIHLAAQAGVRYSLKNPWAYADANYLGTMNIFEVARRNNINRVIFASSSSVYGTNTKMPFSEEDRVDHPMSIYAASKKANEVLAYSYHHLYGIETAGLRFFTVYGEYGRPDLALFRFAKNILTDQPIKVFNNGEMTRNFTYIDDIVQGVLGIVEMEKLSYELYNLGGTEATSLIHFIDLIEKKIGKKAKMEFLPLQPGDVPGTVADISKAKKDFGYNPKTSIEDGVEKFIEWFTENKTWLIKLKDPE